MMRGVDLVFESDLPSAAGMSSSSALMIAVLLALIRANDSTRPRVAKQHPQRRRRPRGVRGHHRERQHVSRAGRRGRRGHRRRQRRSHRDPLQRAGAAAQFAFCPTVTSVRFRCRPDLSSRSASAASRRARPARRVTTITAPRATPTECSSYGGTRPDGATNRSPPPFVLDATRRAAARLLPTTRSSSTVSTSSSKRAPSSCRPPATARARRSRRVRPHRRAVSGAGRRLLRNQVPETVALVRTARDHGALAASAFGAGFGGSVWALVDGRTPTLFLDRWQNAYRAACPLAAPRSRFFLTRPGPAVIRLEV